MAQCRKAARPAKPSRQWINLQTRAWLSPTNYRGRRIYPAVCSCAIDIESLARRCPLARPPPATTRAALTNERTHERMKRRARRRRWRGRSFAAPRPIELHRSAPSAPPPPAARPKHITTRTTGARVVVADFEHKRAPSDRLLPAAECNAATRYTVPVLRRPGHPGHVSGSGAGRQSRCLPVGRSSGLTVGMVCFVLLRSFQVGGMLQGGTAAGSQAGLVAATAAAAQQQKARSDRVEVTSSPFLA